MLRINSMNTYYGNIHALKGIDFEVNDGELVTLIGSNGAGKSTTLLTIAGVLKAAAGSRIEFDGQDLTRMSPPQIVKLGVTLSPEGREVFPELSVEEDKQELFINYASKVMIGTESLDNFDKFVQEWMDRGGTEVIEEATAQYENGTAKIRE